MQYKISFDNPLTHLLNISAQINCKDSDALEITLPLWRPGRYEAANYSKNLRAISFQDERGNKLNWDKPSANTWMVSTEEASEVHVSYQYFAFTMDAGNSWLDEQLVYINFINCLLFSPKEVDEPCSIFIDLPKDHKAGCGLSFNKGQASTTSFYELVDRPMVASPNLEQLTYSVNNYNFNIWIDGHHNLDRDQLVDHFKKFSQSQIDTFRSFPEDDYHFLILALPYKFYHGVEHANSTVICLGPGQGLADEKLYKELLGVSSHELFHAWNIIKIRPNEMMPYVFHKEVTFPTGFVAEGFTTYYGDLFLSRSGVFSAQQYFNELNTIFNRHFWNDGRLNESVITSSLNLWIDGYTVGAPHKKSSIYVEGAMIALCLDLLIRKATNSEQSLDSVMRKLWENHGLQQLGYGTNDIKKYCEEVSGSDFSSFFEDYIYGTQDKKALVSKLLQFVGCELQQTPNRDTLARHLGLRTVKDGEHLKIAQIAPASIGEAYFSLQDQLLSINGSKPETFEFGKNETLTFEIQRGGHQTTVDFKVAEEKFYYDLFTIRKSESANESQKLAFTNWCGQEF